MKKNIWTIIVDPLMSGEENMRRDELVLEGQRVAGAAPVLRFFRWAEPTVSFGRLQSLEEARSFAKRMGAREIVRRPTGGGLVFHEDGLSLSLAWRKDFAGLPERPREAYQAIHGAIADVLRGLGFSVELFRCCGGEKGPSGSPTQGGEKSACFSGRNGWVEGDLIWQGKKVAGGAMRAASWGRLYQGEVKVKELGADIKELVRAIEVRLGFGYPDKAKNTPHPSLPPQGGKEKFKTHRT